MTEVTGIVLQYGFAGILLVFVWLVNRQFMTLVETLGKHLGELMRLLEKCIDCKEKGNSGD